MLRKLGEVVYLLPGEDALAVWLRARQNAWGRAGSYQDEVRVDGLLVSVLINYGGTLVAAVGISFMIMRELAEDVNTAGY